MWQWGCKERLLIKIYIYTHINNPALILKLERHALYFSIMMQSVQQHLAFSVSSSQKATLGTETK